MVQIAMGDEAVMPNASMSPREERNLLLQHAFEGEVVGYSMFTHMGLATDDDACRTTLQLLEAVERATAAALLPVLERYDVAADQDGAAERGKRFADDLIGRPWTEIWAEILPLARAELCDLERLSELLDEEDERVGTQVVEHESALIDFAERVIAGTADATRQLRRYLNHFV
ncbi:MAG: hypothetical protein ACOH2Q_13165 [Rhodococcus sp. (in: high G+C Gram-positive bacteria)]